MVSEELLVGNLLKHLFEAVKFFDFLYLFLEVLDFVHVHRVFHDVDDFKPVVLLFFQESFDLANGHEGGFELRIKVEHKEVFEKGIIFGIDVELFLVTDDSSDDFFCVFLFFHRFIISDRVMRENNRAVDFFFLG